MSREPVVARIFRLSELTFSGPMHVQCLTHGRKSRGHPRAPLEPPRGALRGRDRPCCERRSRHRAKQRHPRGRCLRGSAHPCRSDSTWADPAESAGVQRPAQEVAVASSRGCASSTPGPASSSSASHGLLAARADPRQAPAGSRRRRSGTARRVASARRASSAARCGKDVRSTTRRAGLIVPPTHPASMPLARARTTHPACCCRALCAVRPRRRRWPRECSRRLHGSA